MYFSRSGIPLQPIQRAIHPSMLRKVYNENDKDETDGVEESSTMRTSNPHLVVANLEVRKLSKTKKATKCDLVWLGISIITHIVDFFLDFYVAIRYLIDRQYTYSSLTIIFIFFPSLVNMFLSLQMSMTEEQENTLKDGMTEEQAAEEAENLRGIELQIQEIREMDRRRDVETRNRSNSIKSEGTTETQSCRKIMALRNMGYIFVFLFQLAPVLLYCNSLRWARKTRKRNVSQNVLSNSYMKMLRANGDVAFLKVVECFLEAAPQLVLQLTILLNANLAITWENVHQVLSVCSSLISMGWCMASFHIAIRLPQSDKKNIDFMGKIFQFLWHFFIAVSRILSITVVASIAPWWTVGACVLHWILMTTWLVIESEGVTAFCQVDSTSSPTIWENIKPKLFAAVLGIVYIFSFVNTRDESTFFRYLFYNVLCLVENVAAAGVWTIYAGPDFKSSWFYELMTSLCIVPFCIGIASMIVYYVFFHPRKRGRNANSMRRVADSS